MYVVKRINIKPVLLFSEYFCSFMIVLGNLDNILVVAFNRIFFHHCRSVLMDLLMKKLRIVAGFILSIITLYFSYCSGNVSYFQISFQKNRFMSK